VRETERRDPHGGGFLSTVVLVGGAIYAAVAMAAIGWSPRSGPERRHLPPPGLAALAAMIFAFSIAARGVRSLPRWLGWFEIFAGLAALASIFLLTMLIWLLWIAVTSLVQFARFRSADPTAEPTSA